jgi:hypothetical protein
LPAFVVFPALLKSGEKHPAHAGLDFLALFDQAKSAIVLIKLNKIYSGYFQQALII